VPRSRTWSPSGFGSVSPTSTTSRSPTPPCVTKSPAGTATATRRTAIRGRSTETRVRERASGADWMRPSGPCPVSLNLPRAGQARPHGATSLRRDSDDPNQDRDETQPHPRDQPPPHTLHPVLARHSHASLAPTVQAHRAGTTRSGARTARSTRTKTTKGRTPSGHDDPGQPAHGGVLVRQCLATAGYPFAMAGPTHNELRVSIHSAHPGGIVNTCGWVSYTFAWRCM
jgi:hypothetical protein